MYLLQDCSHALVDPKPNTRSLAITGGTYNNN